jgi:hypothetical protein
VETMETKDLLGLLALLVHLGCQDHRVQVVLLVSLEIPGRRDNLEPRDNQDHKDQQVRKD